MNTTHRQQSGFTAVELLITLFVAAAFLIAGFQLFNVVIRDGGQTRAESRAANIAYDYMRQYSGSATNPCTAQNPLSGSPLDVAGLTNTTVSAIISCPSDAPSSMSKIEVIVNYNSPVQSVTYSTFVSSSGGSASTAITNGLVGWWKMNGDPISSVGAFGGTSYNAVPGNHNGVPNTAYDFNGTNAYIEANGTGGLSNTNATLSAWVYSATATNSGQIIKVGGAGYGIGIGSTSYDDSAPGTKIVMLFEGIRWIPTTADFGTGWHHLAMVIGNTGVPTLYKDGVLVGSYAGANSSVPSGNTLFGGSNTAAVRWFDGNIDDVRFYNRALTAAEVLALYNGGWE